MKRKIYTLMIMGLSLLQMGSQALCQQTKFIEGFPQRSFEHWPRLTPPPGTGGIHAPYRTIDGTNNNIANSKSEYGATNIPLFREMPAEYGPSNPNSAMNGITRPSPREISNLLCDEPVTQFNSRDLSNFVYVWGQFIDHDISLTPQGTTELEPVLLPANENVFVVPIPFLRSEPHPGTGINNKREQTNLITAWIDGSQVYGSDPNRASWLRTFQQGKMKTSSGNMLPWNTTTGEQTDPIDPNAPSMGNDANHTVKTFVAGDVRAAEHPSLTAMHTLFIREHNRICDRLIAEGLSGDEEIYQKARKEVGAIIQSITYEEFLPALGVTLKPYTRYKSNVRPDIANTFATAGYRLGHTMVADEIHFTDNECEEVGDGEVDLVDAFFNPQIITDIGLEPILKGNATHKQYETDTKINSVLRNFLFGPGTGIDLASLNIQRGRDHGLPNYNAVRQFYTGTAATSFSQISNNATMKAGLQAMYGDVNNIDLWVGILAENRLKHKSVGKTVHAMLKSQFEKIRDGDYYFYLNDPFLAPVIRAQIMNTTLADVIIRNTSLTNLQNNVFFLDACPGEDGEDRAAPELAGSDFSPMLKMYPNPASEFISVNLSDYDSDCEIKIFSTAGMLLNSVKTKAGESQIELDLTNYLPGVYIIQLVCDQESATGKFVVN